MGVLATGVAAAVPLVWRWVNRRGRYVLVMLGSFLIAALVYAGAGGAASATYAGFYVWVAVYSFVFFPPRWAALQVVVAVATQVVTLVEVGGGGAAPAQVTLSAGTIVATGAVVGSLAARLRTLTLTDELTGLPNRRSLDATLDDRLHRDRVRPSVAVLALDLDGFKALNDTLGHAAGDRLLQQVAAAWSAELRQGDVLARSGGDEFIAVLADCDDERAKAVAARMVAGIPTSVSACVGLVVVPGGKGATDADLPGLLGKVDAALYEGKSLGPGSVVARAMPLRGHAVPSPRKPTPP